MALKDRIVQIAYELKDRFTSRIGKITGGFREVESASNKSSAQIERNNTLAGRSFGSLLAGIGKAKLGLLALGAVLVSGVSAIGRWTAATNVQERAETKLATTLTNLTGASKEQIQALKDQAGALQQLTGYGDEQTISAQAMLGTFQLTAEQIQALTPRLLDMAEASRKAGQEQVDLESISIALGKAFTSGIGSLSRYGVAMSDTQKKAFKLADQNEKVRILTEVLDGNFKGLAEAVGETYEGEVRKGDAAQGDFLETLGKLFTENKAFIGLQKLITDAWVKIGEGISGSAADIGVVVTALANIVTGAANSIRIAFNIIQIAIKTAVAAVLPVLELLSRTLGALTFGDLSQSFKSTADDIRSYSRDLRDGISRDFTDIDEALTNFSGIAEKPKIEIDEDQSKQQALSVSERIARDVAETFDQTAPTVNVGVEAQTAQAVDAIVKARDEAQAKVKPVVIPVVYRSGNSFSDRPFEDEVAIEAVKRGRRG